MEQPAPDYVIEYTLNAGETWQHGRTIPAWVMRDAVMLRLQRAAVRNLAREWHGEGAGAIRTRTLRADDPKGALNQPAAPAPQPDDHGHYPDDAKVTASRLQLVQTLMDMGLLAAGAGEGLGDELFGRLLKRTTADFAARLEGRPEGKP